MIFDQILLTLFGMVRICDKLVVVGHFLILRLEI